MIFGHSTESKAVSFMGENRALLLLTSLKAENSFWRSPGFSQPKQTD